MNGQRKAFILLTSVICSGMSVFAGAPLDPLWQKAVAVAGTNADWVAGLVVLRSEIVYQGETNGVHELWKRSRPGTNGAVITETVKVLEDGMASERDRDHRECQHVVHQCGISIHDDI
jgi:hypothetical protein